LIRRDNLDENVQPDEWVKGSPGSAEVTVEVCQLQK
jgi:hypothetical protein